MQKGQLEFAVLVGILALIVVVVVYAFMSGSIFPTPVPSGVEQEQKLIADSVTNIGRQGADLSILWLEQQGGYMSPDLNESVVFTKVAVPYWQKCSRDMAPTLPEITGRLQDAMKNYFNYTLHGKKDYFGKNVTFDLAGLSVSANILKNKVDFSVHLPTKVQGQAVNQPYAFSVPTKLGEVHEFMASYARDAATNRYLELFILNSMYFSNTASDGHPEVPTVGMLSQCGEVVSRTPEQLSSALEGIVEYTLANTAWWQPTSTDPTKPKIYGIESLGGKTYRQLDPLFYLSDRFDIPIASSIYMTNPRPLFSSRVLTSSGLCVTTYFIQYSLTFPVILRVRDDLTGHYFNIATLVDVNEMEPGSCSGHRPSITWVNKPTPSGGVTEYVNSSEELLEALGCPDADCMALVTVKKPNGQPARGSSAVFGGCVIGIADASGMIRGNMTCGRDDLNIYHLDGYMYRRCNISSSEVGGTYTVYKYPRVNASIYEVDAASCTKRPASHYSAITLYSPGSGCTDYWNNVDVPDSGECEAMDDASCAKSLLNANMRGSASGALQPGGYNIALVLLNITKAADISMGSKTTIGALNVSLSIGTADRAIKINVPITAGRESISSAEADALVNEMKIRCGIDPLEE